MFDFLKSDQAQAEKAEKKEQDFVRERDTVRMASADDATYLETQKQRSDLLRWQQEFNTEVQELYHELLSEMKTAEGWEQKQYKEWDATKKIYVTKKVPRLCTPAFAEKLIRIAVKPWLNKNAINSNLQEKTIRSMLRNTHNDVVGAISDGWGGHGIETVDAANAISRMVKNYIDPAAYRALNGWTKRTDGTMIKRIEASQEQTADIPQKKGWGLFNG